MNMAGMKRVLLGAMIAAAIAGVAIAVAVFYPRAVNSNYEIAPFPASVLSQEEYKELLETLGSAAFRRDIVSRSAKTVARVDARLTHWQLLSTGTSIILEIQTGPLNLFETGALNQLVHEFQEESRMAIALTLLRHHLNNGQGVIIWDSKRKPLVDMLYCPVKGEKIHSPVMVTWDASRIPKSRAVRQIIMDIENKYPGYYLDILMENAVAPE